MDMMKSQTTENNYYFYKLTLNYICITVITKGVFPGRLKYSALNPLYIKGNKRDVSNYRPISLLPSF